MGFPEFEGFSMMGTVMNMLQPVGQLKCFTGIAVWVQLLLLHQSLAAGAGPGLPARSANDFLNSLGTLSAISVRGEKLEKTIESTKYLGIRWLRAGIEGNVPLEQFVQLHEQAGL